MDILVNRISERSKDVSAGDGLHSQPKVDLMVD
jgi:hypothetical protein